MSIKTISSPYKPNWIVEFSKEILFFFSIRKLSLEKYILKFEITLYYELTTYRRIGLRTAKGKFTEHFTLATHTQIQPSIQEFLYLLSVHVKGRTYTD